MTRTSAWLTLTTGVAVIIGALLSWVDVNVALLGSISRSGMDGDGKITVVLGFTLASIGVSVLSGRTHNLSASRAGSMLCGLLISAVAGYDVVNITSTDLPSLAVASPGIGLWLTLIAGVGAIAAALSMKAQPWPPPTTWPVPAHPAHTP